MGNQESELKILHKQEGGCFTSSEQIVSLVFIVIYKCLFSLIQFILDLKACLSTIMGAKFHEVNRGDA